VFLHNKNFHWRPTYGIHRPRALIGQLNVLVLNVSSDWPLKLFVYKANSDWSIDIIAPNRNSDWRQTYVFISYTCSDLSLTGPGVPRDIKSLRLVILPNNNLNLPSNLLIQLFSIESSSKWTQHSRPWKESNEFSFARLGSCVVFPGRRVFSWDLLILI